MIERFIVAKSLGEAHLQYKINAVLEDGSHKLLRVEDGDIPMAGSTSSPYAASWGRTEPGWTIVTEIVPKEQRMRIAG